MQGGVCLNLMLFKVNNAIIQVDYVPLGNISCGLHAAILTLNIINPNMCIMLLP